ncbi:hypothetical protein TNIN_398941 [Trichonephila inaurata madagascariensis]|uniref:Uncharacterized protein n=1 Tax=Trichonephila inaurata madagascariensis TaxID=2747483 RepID=A0A8X6WMD9_9ARAC|nr:hypothetical protein TNIN_398941 [Trichonephila inaurata madagascariensis]
MFSTVQGLVHEGKSGRMCARGRPGRRHSPMLAPLLVHGRAWSPLKTLHCPIHADKNEDDDLKKTVQNFIVEHGKGIVNSDAWEKLMKTHIKLAVDTLVLTFK